MNDPNRRPYARDENREIPERMQKYAQLARDIRAAYCAYRDTIPLAEATENCADEPLTFFWFDMAEAVHMNYYSIDASFEMDPPPKGPIQ